MAYICVYEHCCGMAKFSTRLSVICPPFPTLPDHRVLEVCFGILHSDVLFICLAYDMIFILVAIFRLFDLDRNVIILFSVELFDHDGYLGC